MKQSLGRGLQSLIPKKQPRITSLVKGQTARESWLKPKKESIFNIEIDKIRPNPHQPRQELSDENLKELANSIREHGILQPLIVTKVEKPTARGQQVEYELVVGERRWRAAQMAGLPHVPVVIRDSSAYEKLELALVENIQREDLNPIERARAFKQLQDEFKLKHGEIAKKVGKKRTTITNTLRLLTLPLKIQGAIASGRVTEGHGKAILAAKPAARMTVYQAIVRNSLDVRQAETRARALSIAKPRSSGPKNLLFRKLEKDLGAILGRRVSITRRGDVGRLVLEFRDEKELTLLVDYLSKF